MPLAPAERLPRTQVVDVRSGRDHPVPWRPHGVSVLVLPHPHCEACRAFLEELDAAGGRFADWGARVRAVVADEQAARALTERLDGDVLHDEGRLRRHAGVSPEGAAVLVIDVFGQVYASRDLAGHHFPDVDEVVAEARYPALQCPECETPDVPVADRLPG